METHNVHEDNERVQEGVTEILEYDKILGWMSDLVTYRAGMGRWCWIKMKGNNRHICRIFWAYHPCGKTSTQSIGVGTLYYQQRRYHRAILDICCHRMLLREELVREIKNGKEEKIMILIMDTNEDQNKVKSARGLTHLGMIYLVTQRTGGKGPATQFRVKNILM